MTKQGNPVTWTTCMQQPTREVADISKSLPPKSASASGGLFLSRLTGSDNEEAGDAGDGDGDGGRC